MTERHFPYREEDYTANIAIETLGDGHTVYVASYPELVGCMAHGDTEQEARENLSEAFEMVMDHLQEFNLPIPAPSHSAVQQVVLESYLTSNRPLTRFIVTGGAQQPSVTQMGGVPSAEWLRLNAYFQMPSLSIDQLVSKPAAPAEVKAS